MARVLVVTGRGFRHLWLLDMAMQRLGQSLRGAFIQADRLPRPLSANRWSRWRREAKRTLRRMGIRTPVYLDLSAVERHIWQEHGEPRIDWDSLGLEHATAGADPNSPEAIAWLEQARPDLVLVFGGKILSAPWYELPRLGALNLHYGITSAYRGAESTTWAAYHRNWDYIGSTVHYVDAGIDTGPVVRETRVAVERGDDLNRLTARVYWRGMQALIDAASEAVRCQERLPAQPPPRCREHLYNARECTYEVRQVADANVRSRGGERLARLHPSTAEARDWAESLVRRSRANDTLPPGVYILLYHDISEPEQRPWGRHAEISTRPAFFNEHLRYLSACGRWVTPDEACRELTRGAVSEPLLVLTFDDGFASNYCQAASIVQHFGIRPLLFLNGATMETGHVHYRVLAATLAAQGRSEMLCREIARNGRRFRGPPRPSDVSNWLKQNYRPEWTDRVTATAYRQVNGELPRELYLTHKQLGELLSAGWELGNHTWSHARLARLRPREVAAELEGNEQWLTTVSGRRPRWISYPYGFSADVGPAALEWVERDPQRIGLMAQGGINFFLDRMALARIPVGDQDLPSFRQSLHQSIIQSQYAAMTMMLRK